MRLKSVAAGVCLFAALASVILLRHPARVTHAAGSAPVYAPNGDMLPVTSYREWVYLTTGIDMSYNPKATGGGESMFDNVFVNPEAWRSFQATGTWPDKTMIVLEGRVARSRGSINTHGQFQTEQIMSFEVHVKDEARFAGKWAFFDFDAPDKNGKLIPEKAPCYSCHQQHGAVDATFVQFYPTLLPIARAKHTYDEQKASAEVTATK